MATSETPSSRQIGGADRRAFGIQPVMRAFAKSDQRKNAAQ